MHDLRHTAAARLAADPDITLVEVQTIMRHAHLTTTGLYTSSGPFPNLAARSLPAGKKRRAVQRLPGRRARLVRR